MSQPSDPATGMRCEAGDIADSYIVLLKEYCEFSEHIQFVKSLETKYQHSNGCKLTHEYGADGVFGGYSVTLKGDAYQELASSDAIEKICHDTIAGCEIDLPGNELEGSGTGDGRGYDDTHEDIVAQLQPEGDGRRVARHNAPWGLQRISQRNGLPAGSRPDDLNFTYRREQSDTPVPVDVYVLDTGLNIEHREFASGDRARWGENFTRTGNSDIEGHGTHVASTIAGERFGIAQHANVISVKVIGDRGYGAASQIIAGIDWSIKRAKSTGRASVINISLIAHHNDLLDQAATKAVEAGVHVCVAAGNSNVRAHNWSPAGARGVITVGTTTIQEERRYDSNVGGAIDIFAPGCTVISACARSRDGHRKRSGSSMATAHVAGVIAHRIYLEGNKAPDRMLAQLKDLGIKDALRDIPPDTVNLLLSNGVY